jgi:hypothetical protein
VTSGDDLNAPPRLLAREADLLERGLHAYEVIARLRTSGARWRCLDRPDHGERADRLELLAKPARGCGDAQRRPQPFVGLPRRSTSAQGAEVTSPRQAGREACRVGFRARRAVRALTPVVHSAGGLLDTLEKTRRLAG